MCNLISYDAMLIIICTLVFILFCAMWAIVMLMQESQVLNVRCQVLLQQLERALK